MLSFNTDLPQLKAAINFVRNGLGSSKTDTHVMLIRGTVAGAKLTLFAANKEMFGRAEVKITREGDEAETGFFAVMGDKLVALVNSLETEKIYFEADSEAVKVSAGFLVVSLVQYDGSSLRQAEVAVAEHLSKEGDLLQREMLVEALGCAKACSTTNSIRPDVTHIEFRNGKMLSSDGRKILIYAPVMPKEADKMPGLGRTTELKVPAAILNPVLSAVKNISSERVQVATGASYYYIKSGLNEFSLGVRRVERSFPDVEGQLKILGPPADDVSVDRNVLSNMLTSVALGLDSDEVRVQVDVEGQKPSTVIEISAKNSLGRRSHERTSCGRQSTDGAPISFPISFKHLLDMMPVFKGDTVVDLLVYPKMNLVVVHDHTPARDVNTIIPFRTEQVIAEEEREAKEAADAKKADKAETVVTDTPEDGVSAAASAAVAEDVDLT